MNKGRKTFDSGKQRATGSDVIYAKTKETQKVYENKIEVFLKLIILFYFINELLAVYI